MRLTCNSHESPMRIVVGNTSMRHDFHAILCKFHKTPLKCLYVKCACLAIATRHPRSIGMPHDSLSILIHLTDLHIKRRTIVDFSYGSAPGDTKLKVCIHEDASISTCILSQHNIFPLDIHSTHIRPHTAPHDPTRPRSYTNATRPF